ncbi:hypothetical protein PS6_011754 [Mucor atramentarius]
MSPKRQTETESPLSSRESTLLEQGSLSQHQVHLDEKSAREDLEHLNLKDHTQSEEGQEGSSMTAASGHEEDVIMQETQDLKPVVPQVNKKDPILVLKQEASDEKSTIKHIGEIRTNLENLNKDISVLKNNSVRWSNDKVTASSVEDSALAIYAAGSNGGIRLSK